VRDDTAAEELGWRLGVQAWTFRDRTCFEAIDTAARLGLKYIELYPGQVLSPKFPTIQVGPDMVEVYLIALRSKQREDNVRAVSFGVVGLSKDEAATRKVFEFAPGRARAPALPRPDRRRVRDRHGRGAGEERRHVHRVLRPHRASSRVLAAEIAPKRFMARFAAPLRRRSAQIVEQRRRSVAKWLRSQ
jgi:hypothetical protein